MIIQIQKSFNYHLENILPQNQGPPFFPDYFDTVQEKLLPT